MSQLLRSRLVTLLLTGDTHLLRLFFSVGSLAMAVWILFDEAYPIDHHVSVGLINEHFQVVLFAIHGVAVWYGNATNRYSIALLFCEGLLGVGLWVGIGLSEMVQQGVPGPMLVSGGSIAVFLLMRYPTHYEADK